MLPGVYKAYTTKNILYYRSNITYQNKHISLGSFSVEADANSAYLEASAILSDSAITLDGLTQHIDCLSFSKAISLINFRDNHLYIPNPIYLRSNYFEYYLSSNECLKFDIEDLFYYSSHKIMKRGGHLFVNEYGMQYTILARYGIRNYAVPERDYQFANGDSTDFRYSNIIIVNSYYGVTEVTDKTGKCSYKAKIHINGDFILGEYQTVTEAAIAYNKAVDLLNDSGLSKNYNVNYIDSLTSSEYAEIYTKIKLSTNLNNYIKKVCCFPH